MLLFHFIYSCRCKCGVHRIEMNTVEQKEKHNNRIEHMCAENSNELQLLLLPLLVLTSAASASASADDDEYALHTYGISFNSTFNT